MKQNLIEIQNVNELVAFVNDYESMGGIDYKLNPHMVLFHIFFALQKEYSIEQVASEDRYAYVRIKTRDDFTELECEYLTLHLLTKKELILRYYLFVGTNLNVFNEHCPFGEKIRIRSEDCKTMLFATNITVNVSYPDYRFIRASTAMINKILDVAEKILPP